MKIRRAIYHRLSLLASLVFLLPLMFLPERAYAQWPPFKFDLEPSYAGGRITYRIELSGRVEWTMADITLKIPLPEGTRFLEASARPTTRVSFDGAEVTFLTFSSQIKDAYFVVEVADPEIAVYTTHAWISWGGDQPGDYLTEDVSIDITLQPLNWEKPPRPRLQAELGATVVHDLITYSIYLVKNTDKRMWDVRIAVPVPAGTTFLSAQAPAPFVVGFDGQEVSFAAVELGEESESEPLRFTVSTQGVMAPVVVTHAWVTWKNVGKKAGQNIPAQEQARTGDIGVQPRIAQWAVVDRVGDVPLANYDLTSVVLQQEKSALKVIFNTAGDVGPEGEPLQFILYIDKDCRPDSGKPENGRGVEYRVRYKHDKRKAVVVAWDEVEDNWSDTQSFEVNNLVGDNMVAVWVPYELLKDGRRFCWVAEAKNKTTGFDSTLPAERVPDSKDLRITQYAALMEATTIGTQPSTEELSSSEMVVESGPADITTSLPEPKQKVTREGKRIGGRWGW